MFKITKMIFFIPTQQNDALKPLIERHLKKVWSDALNPDLSNRLTLANILENEDLVSNVKRLGIF